MVKEIEKLHQGSETIAAAAEESASAVSEVTNTIASQVKAFNESQKAAELLEKLIKNHDDKAQIELSTASEELEYSINTLENSMAQVIEALSQIEEAADISLEDASKNLETATSCVKYVENAYNKDTSIEKDFEEILKLFDEIASLIEEIVSKSGKNSNDVISQKEAINVIKSKINKLNNFLRKIELSIVQISALSINGAVEAIKYGEEGSGFSEVSNDIKKLAETSEKNLDEVIEIIDNVNEKNNEIGVDINNIYMILDAEKEKLASIEEEFKKNKKNLLKIIEKNKKLLKSIEEMKIALEQSKIAASQIKEAAEISKKNASESKEAAKIILNITKEMSAYIKKLRENSINLLKE